ISDTSSLEAAVQAAIEANPQPVEDFRQGKKQALGFLVGQIMKTTKGQANPQMVRELLAKALNK
ncbi:MAG: Asp-tRNA(Asn)/Glu-tRNA(Gln) amidotransferase GatCAB subunit B, partial [Clostridiales bacterium]